MITFQNVSKRYPNGHEALSQVSFHIKKGEMAFLTGHSGAGKSSILKLIALIENVTQGQILVNGERISLLKKSSVPWFRRQVGIIFQSPQLLSHRTVFDNVAMPLVIAEIARNEINRRTRAALDVVGLLAKERCFPGTLSEGERQRVGIARAVVNRPPVLLADEPTGNLDPKLSAEMMSLFDRLHQVGVSLLIATHDLGLIAQRQHRILTLKEGKLL